MAGRKPWRKTGRRVAEPTCIIKTRTRCHSGQCSRIAEEVSEVHHM